MILTDYLRCDKNLQWDYAKQCGVTHAVIRLPEDKEFDITSEKHWEEIYRRFLREGITPIVVEPMPDYLHNHIKVGDEERDACIEKVIRMLPIMSRLNIRTICFNFMAHLGWLRTAVAIPERGGALVTGFRLKDFQAPVAEITAQELWDNYIYFIRAVLPEAEKYGVRFALHPDDPPIEKLGKISRIMINSDNIRRALAVYPSKNLGITMCQATFAMMGGNLYSTIEEFKDKIFFVHFRNVTGHKEAFRETFHDNGQLNMAGLIAHYRRCGIHVPIRVDHVPCMAGEENQSPGYASLGRLFAIGYLKGLLDADSTVNPD